MCGWWGTVGRRVGQKRGEQGDSPHRVPGTEGRPSHPEWHMPLIPRNLAAKGTLSDFQDRETEAQRGHGAVPRIQIPRSSQTCTVVAAETHTHLRMLSGRRHTVTSLPPGDPATAHAHPPPPSPRATPLRGEPAGRGSAHCPWKGPESKFYQVRSWAVCDHLLDATLLLQEELPGTGMEGGKG